MKMTKTQYEAIAKPFAKETNWIQYLYAHQGFEKVNGIRQHSQRGREFYSYFKDLDEIVFAIANNLSELNEKFDRDKFLETCGMLNDGQRGWSFVPTSEYIKRATTYEN